MAPWATVTEGGTLRAEVVLLARVTLAPPACAPFDRVIVHVVVEDAGTGALAHCSELSAAGATNERFAVVLSPFRVAVIVAA